LRHVYSDLKRVCRLLTQTEAMSMNNLVIIMTPPEY
jgi:hypothetical protein